VSEGRVDLGLQANGAVDGIVDLLLPDAPLTGEAENLVEGVYRFHIRFENRGSLDVRY
jgi:hypothetical protein